MSLDLKFARLCEKSFIELEGSDNLTRYCRDCQIRVINFDPLVETAQAEILKIAAQAELELCVAATIPVNSTAPPCAIHRLRPQPLMGAVKLPETVAREQLEYQQKLQEQEKIETILEQERERLDPTRSATRRAAIEAAPKAAPPSNIRQIFAKLKFWK